MKSVLKTRRLGFEGLEKRELLAGGSLPVPPPAPVAMPSVTVKNLAVPVVDILPGATDVSVSKFALKSNSGREYARLEEVLVIPAWGSEQLSGNMQRFTLRADLNGKPKDGYETVLATAYADYQTDTVDFMVYKPVWIRGSKPVQFQITGSVSAWPWSNSADAEIGVEVAQVFFRNLRNEPVPDERVVYAGVDPTLHTLETKTFSVYQQPLDSSSSVLAGQKDVELIEFSSYWSDGVAPDSVTFVAGQGDLSNAQNYSLWVDINWDGALDYCVQASVMPKNGKVVFSFDSNPSQGLYEVHADIADVLAADPRIQLVFNKDGSGITAKDTETGNALRGVIVNGNGAGQIRLSQYPQFSPVYDILPQSPLVSISLSGSSPMDQTVVQGPVSVTLLTLKVVSAYADAQLSGIGFKLTPVGDGVPLPMPNFEKISVFADGVDLTSMASIIVREDQIDVEFLPGLVIPGNTFKTITLKGVVSNECSFRASVSGAWSSDITTRWGNCNAVGNKITVE